MDYYTLQFEHGEYLYDGMTAKTPMSVKQAACFLRKIVEIKGRQMEWHPKPLLANLLACCTAGSNKTTLEEAAPCIAAIAPAADAIAEAIKLYIAPAVVSDASGNGTVNAARVLSPAVEAQAASALSILVPLVSKQLKGVHLSSTAEQELLLAEDSCGEGQGCDPTGNAI